MRAPRYGQQTVADLTVTVLGRLGVPGGEARVDVELADRVVLLVLDGVVVVPREHAVEAGWFGPVAGEVRGRIGDVVAVCTGRTNLVHASQDPLGGRLAGMHAGLSETELQVPLILAHGS